MEKAIEIKRRAQRCILSGDLDGALSAYEKLIATGDSDPYHSVLLADLLFKKGDHESASKRYLDAVAGYEKMILYKNAIAVCKKMSRLALASEAVLQQLANLHALDGLATESSLYYMQHADALLQRKQGPRAIESLRRAFQVCPDNVKALERLGDVLAESGSTEEAANTLVEAAGHYERLGQVAEAKRVQARAYELVPELANAPSASAPPLPPPASEPSDAAPAVDPPSIAGSTAVPPTASNVSVPSISPVPPNSSPVVPPAVSPAPPPAIRSASLDPVVPPATSSVPPSPDPISAPPPPAAAAPAPPARPAAPAPPPPPPAPRLKLRGQPRHETSGTTASISTGADDFVIERNHYGSSASSSVPTPALEGLESSPSANVPTPPLERLESPTSSAPTPALEGLESSTSSNVRTPPLEELESSTASAGADSAEPVAANGDEQSGEVTSTPARPGIRFDWQAAEAAGANAPGLPEVSVLLEEAQELFKSGEREAASASLVRAAQAYDRLGRYDSAAAIYRSLSKATDPPLTLMLLWLKNCQRRDDRQEASKVACELGDRAIMQGDVAGAREWFERAHAFDGGNDTARRRLERILNGSAAPVATQTAVPPTPVAPVAAVAPPQAPIAAPSPTMSAPALPVAPPPVEPAVAPPVAAPAMPVAPPPLEPAVEPPVATPALPVAPPPVEPVVAPPMAAPALPFEPPPVEPTPPGPRVIVAPPHQPSDPGLIEVSVAEAEPLVFDLGNLISEFQRGLEAQLASDPQGHYDLGMSYCEMGLYDEAIASFELAAFAPTLQLRATEMIARCNLERGDFDGAAKQFQAAMEMPALNRAAQSDLRFQLGLAFEAGGRMDQALECFERIYAEQPNYPDVAQKIRALRKALEKE